MKDDDMADSEIYFDMGRLKKKKMGQERSEKEIMEGLFGGNITCTSLELRHSSAGQKKEEQTKAQGKIDSVKDYDLLEISLALERNMKILHNLNQRITNNLKAIESSFKDQFIKASNK